MGHHTSVKLHSMQASYEYRNCALKYTLILSICDVLNLYSKQHLAMQPKRRICCFRQPVCLFVVCFLDVTTLLVVFSTAPYRALTYSFSRFLDHTQRFATFGRTPLDECSIRRRDLYLTTHNTHNRHTSMPPVGFEPTISAGERP